MTIGERIKQRREELGMTQEELAERIGYKSKTSINKIELGVQNLKQSKIKAIADALDTTPSYIMGWDEAEEEQPQKRVYYLDPETAETAQELFDDPNLRILFDAARDSRPSDLKMAADLLMRLKETNPDG